MSNGARTIIVESPDRFARDLMVQLAGHDMLKAKGHHASLRRQRPTFFLEDTPTAVLVRQVLGAVAQFEKATTRRQAGGRAEAEARHWRQGRGPQEPRRDKPGRCGLAKRLARKKPKGGKMSLRAIRRRWPPRAS